METKKISVDFVAKSHQAKLSQLKTNVHDWCELDGSGQLEHLHFARALSNWLSDTEQNKSFNEIFTRITWV